MEKLKHYIVYKTINLITKEFYFGVHGQLENDNYLGSGIRLRNQINKYGKNSFLRETISVWKTEAEAFKEEKKILEKWRGNPLCLNISPGGDGGANFLGKTHSQETKDKIRMISSKRILSKDTRDKISEANRNRPQELKQKFIQAGVTSTKNRSKEEQTKINTKVSNALAGRKRGPHTESTKQKISEAAKTRFKQPGEKEKSSKHQKEIWEQKDKEAWGELQRSKWTPAMRKKQSEIAKSRIPWNRKLKCGHIVKDKCSCLNDGAE